MKAQTKTAYHQKGNPTCSSSKATRNSLGLHNSSICNQNFGMHHHNQGSLHDFNFGKMPMLAENKNLSKSTNITHTINSDSNPITETAHTFSLKERCSKCEKEDEKTITDSVKTETQGLGPLAPTGGSNHCSITNAQFDSIPSGTLPCSFTGTKYGASFNMTATFDSNIPCNSANGEYRQYVKGYFKKNGTKVTHNLCANTLDENAFHEDCATIGGTDYKYGYRSIRFGTSYFDTPDQAGGRKFNGYDHPGITGSSGDTVEVKLHFIGKLVDISQGNKVLKSSSWKVEGTDTAP